MTIHRTTRTRRNSTPDRPQDASGVTPVRSQRGAVLFVALIMLILLALLGIAGMQVSTLQERMSSNYRASNLAFQNAEALARNVECVLEDITNSVVTPGCNAIAPAAVLTACDTGFNPNGWSGSFTLATPQAVTARQIGQCIAGDTALDMGTALNANPNPVYQVTAYMSDDAANPAAAASIDTIFRP